MEVEKAVQTSRPLVLKRNARGCISLHDAETGELLAGQRNVQVTESANDYTTVTVTFLATPASDVGVRIQVNDSD